jgi:predicted ATPase
VCIYRPVISLFTSHQINSISNPYQEINLQDLSSSESQGMVESLLKTDTVPPELNRFIQKKVEGNPFYIEEMINSLIESETLVRDNSHWKVTRPIAEAEISSTIHGVIAGRIDRLSKEAKKILKEASVIGRAFLYEILIKITELESHVDKSLSGLERLDLIRTRTIQPDIEYIFKHALTQEVVYNSLLKSRKEIHERIGHVMEHLFSSRLAEFYETLAFHFKQGHSVLKAVDYLMKSGKKSLNRYAIEEAHQYYQEAYDLLSNKPSRTEDEDKLLIELLNDWGMVYYYRGAFRDQYELLKSHESLASRLNDRVTLGMFYAWLGASIWFHKENYRESYQYLQKSLSLGEETQNQKVIGYACAWLSWVCTEFNQMEEGIRYGERAQDISKDLPADKYLYFKSLAGMGYAYCCLGMWKQANEAGEAIVNYGEKDSNLRAMGIGHFVVGWSHLICGDLQSAIASCKKSIEVSADPFYSNAYNFTLGVCYAIDGKFQKAEQCLLEAKNFFQKVGLSWTETMCTMYLSVVLIAKGNMNQGFQLLLEAQRKVIECDRKYYYAMSEYLFGSLYLQISC